MSKRESLLAAADWLDEASFALGRDPVEDAVVRLIRRQVEHLRNECLSLAAEHRPETEGATE